MKWHEGSNLYYLQRIYLCNNAVLARLLRIQYEDALYNVTCRGNERKSIFRDDHDKDVFLELLNDGLKTYNIILYCYVLMDNHFHLLLETPLANLSKFMRWFNITYTFHYKKKAKGQVYILEEFVSVLLIVRKLGRDHSRFFAKFKKRP
ncbi:transposase [Candidatus Kuenenia sp.]|uniref:transposase n=1 Tax=Candidatus Kuenenia sp. TaxID=2499824 RepID=UPI00321FF21E